MPEFGELAGAVVHPSSNEKCPFCPGQKESRTTYPGAKNDSGILRDVMNDPSALTSKQGNARPKDGQEGRQGEDAARPSPAPIFRDKEHGPYGDQAHHAISGNEIMKGQPIEKLIVAGQVVEADTGYSINNCANGVYLPAYPLKYAGKWAAMDPKEKHEIMKLPMKKTGIGQAHIGSHKDHLDPGQEKFHRTYPKAVREELEKLRTMVLPWASACGACRPGGKRKEPLPAPYRINGYLDAISEEVIHHLKSPPENWTYFISRYAKDYHAEVCPHGTHGRSMKSVLKARRAAKRAR